MLTPSDPRLRRVGVGLLGGVLLAAMAGCTGGSEPAASPSPSPHASTGTATTLEARPVPLQVRVTRVAGKLDKGARADLERNVGAVVGSYFDDAFLAGTYPRTDFAEAFSVFSKGAAAKARADRDLLTNAALGGATQSVTPRKKAAYLSVLAPNGVAAGVTARIDLELVADGTDGEDKLVTLTGRLLLTRKASGGWQVFGYDVARSAVPVQNGAS